MSLKLSIITILVILVFATFAQEKKPSQEEVVITPILREPLPEVQREPTACDFLNGGLGSIDLDNDSIDNCDDNCIFDKNKNQKDRNKDGVGDACEWRKRRDEEWEKIGRKQRLLAIEPANIEWLAKNSSAIFIAKVTRGLYPTGGDTQLLAGWGGIEIIRQLKGRREWFTTREGGPWIYFPNKGPKEFVAGELLFFVKQGRARRWNSPHVYSGDPLPNGEPYIEKNFFGYKLTDIKYGVLGVSEERIRELEKILKKQQS